ncbi:hypothetical protein RhiirA4_470064 [Rhizophagus irregularis]|uniref:Uncharacterized protein n=1 Tax=Rhizophagus irregularis TaxID=588596 RepID=A0A2I1H0L2_9GLOM|nr:hypothetical protein RhiirA4_470064 [Rhizophagus irregularis]
MSPNGTSWNFNRYALKKVPYTIKRYTDEAKRLHYVSNGALEESIDEFPNLKAWIARIGARPTVQKVEMYPLLIIFKN